MLDIQALTLTLYWPSNFTAQYSLVAQTVKNPIANAGDPGSIPGSGRCPGEGNGNPLQYSCLENSMDRGAWQAAVYSVAKSWAQLSNKHIEWNSSWVYVILRLFNLMVQEKKWKEMK